MDILEIMGGSLGGNLLLILCLEYQGGGGSGAACTNYMGFLYFQ